MSQNSSTSLGKRNSDERTSPGQDDRATKLSNMEAKNQDPPRKIALAVQTGSLTMDVKVKPINVCDDDDTGVILVAVVGFARAKLITNDDVGALRDRLQKCNQESDIDAAASEAAKIVPDVNKDNWKEIIRAWFVAKDGKPGLQALVDMAKQDYDASGSKNVAWSLSHPIAMQYTKSTLEKLQLQFVEATKSSQESLSRPGSKGPALISVQSGVGIGKSQCCDHAAALCFPNVPKDRALVLKVSYNYNQDLKEEANQAKQGLFARLMIDLEQLVPTVSDQGIDSLPGGVGSTVTKFLAQGGELDRDAIVERISQKERDALVIAVDEIYKLYERSEIAAKEVLTAVADILEQLKQRAIRKGDHSYCCTGIITALPKVDFECLSQRVPIPVTLAVAEPDESREILRCAIKKLSVSNPFEFHDENEITRAIITAGGHYRTLVSIAYLAVKERAFPQLQALMEAAVYGRYSESRRQERVILYVKALKEQYTTPAASTPELRDIDREEGVVFDKAILPLCLLATLEGEKDVKFAHLRSMLSPASTELGGPTKVLERFHEHWDAFRAAEGLPVVPDSLCSLPASFAPVARHWPWEAAGLPESLKYCFKNNHQQEYWEDLSILHQTPGRIHPDLVKKDIDENRFYVPRAAGHRAFESMAVAQDEKGTRYLVLYQSKVSVLDDSITKLNVAAADLSSEVHYIAHRLRKGVRRDELEITVVDSTEESPHEKTPAKWNGKFLFIISALSQDLRRVGEMPNHPTLFITDDQLDSYFTPSFAKPARRLKFLHEVSHTIA